jgi:membrane protein DedA with SNARE-associated domain
MPNLALQQIALLQQFSYLGVFIAVVLSGHFVPIPEDISLLMAGYIVAMGYAHLWPMVIIAIIGPFIADGLLYYLARTGSRFVPSLEKYAPGLKIDFIRRQLEEHTFRSVFWMRFVTGFRFMSPVISGYMKIPPSTYLPANFASAFFYGPFFLFLGYFFSQKILDILGTLKSFEHIILWILAAAGVVLVSILVNHYISRKQTKL